MFRAATIRDIPPFTSPLEFEFDERVNLFVGANATGKSTFLRKLAEGRLDLAGNSRPKFAFAAIGEGRLRPHRPGTATAADRLYKKLLDESDDQSDDKISQWLNLERRVRNIVASVPIVYIPATRTSIPLSNDIPSIRGMLGDQMSEQSLSEILGRSVLLNVFDGQVVYRASRNINEGMQTGALSPEVAGQLYSASHLSYQCATEICSEVLDESTNKSFDWVQKLPVNSSGGGNFVVTTVHYDMAVRTVDPQPKDSSPGVFIGDLSSGTQSTLLWIWYMALRMADFYNFQPGWSDRPSVLIIDELENHLHPSWQRRMIPALLKHFPKLQIFTTTHSPFIVAGLESGQVHLLKRDSDNVIVSSTNKEDIIGWTADEILRGFMGVEDPTDDVTAHIAARLRWLRSKEAHQGLEEEELSELNELRSKVGSEILAKGGLNAQRERYADLMQQFLQSRLANTSQDEV